MTFPCALPYSACRRVGSRRASCYAWVALNLLALEFSASQAIATVVAMTSNFVLNNQFT
jgi:putative flippase GtrA